ncbi:tetratricopeptide repeat protein, partial [Klebsiella aerogenes]|uniref:tetratricopeptide repeat protein n=1 Tax=Klebsiella aerogenes TaxID=548 RepID=UPI0039841702
MKKLLICFCLFFPIYGGAAMCEIADTKLCDGITRGDSGAQYTLGALYHSGVFVKQDYSRAKELFEKSASQGNAKAQFLLG